MPDPADRLLDGGERAIAEQVDLDEPQRFERLTVVLRDDHALRRARERDLARQGLAGDHHTSRMGGEMLRPADQPLDQRSASAQRRRQHLQRERPIDLAFQVFVGEPGGEAIQHRGSRAEGLEPFPKRRAPPEGLERRGQRDPAVAEAPIGPIDQLVAAMGGKVQVEVRQARAARMEEALEDEAMLDRVHRRQAEQVHHQRSHRRASTHHLDSDLARVTSDLEGGEEVRGQLPPRDHRQLVRESLVVGFRSPPPRGASRRQSLAGLTLETALRRAAAAIQAGRSDSDRQQVEAALLGHRDGLLQRSRLMR